MTVIIPSPELITDVQISTVLLDYARSEVPDLYDDFYTDKYIQGIYLVKSLSAFPVLVVSFRNEVNLISPKWLFNKLELIGYYYDLQFNKWTKMVDKQPLKLKGF